MPKEKQYNLRSLYFPNRITKTMDEIFAHPLTIIEAPMGYGKTTAVRALLSNAEVNMLWQRIYDSGDISFWNGFAKLFSDLDEDRSQSLVKLGFPDDVISMQDALKLIEGIKLPHKTVLVIDDYHLTESTAVNSFIEFLIENEIYNLHVVLTARFVKFQRLEELKLKGYLYYITKETFEFMPKEIKGYYKTCGITISDSEEQQLYSDTEGWISALYLIMLEYVANGNYTSVESIYILIEKVVYIPLRDEIKEFIVNMCIFDSFTLKQAEFMWGEKKSVAGFLEEITGNNAFVTYESRLKIYNIHSIFAGFLKEIFEGKEINHKQNIFRKAAQWFLEIEDCFAARRYFYEGEDYDGILLALEEDKSNDYSTLNKELLVKYMAKCPSDAKARHHYALLKYAMHLFVHKELELFREICNEFSVNIEKDKGLNLERKNQLLGELELMLSFAEFNDLKKMSARIQKSWQMLNQPTSIYDTGTDWTFGNPSIICLYYRERGRLEEHIKDLKEGLSYYYLLTNGHGSGADYVMEAESYFNQCDFENAEISVQQALLKAKSRADDNIFLNAEYLIIRIAFMNGDLSKVMGLMNNLHERMSNGKKYRYVHSIEMCEGFLYAYLDQKDKIPKWLMEVDLNNLKINFPAFPFFNIAYGRVLLISGEYLKLIGSAEHFISISSVFSNMLGYIYTYIYLSAAYIRIYREDEALSNLKKALEIAMPDKQYMLFVENCDYIEPLLEKIAAEGNYREGIKKILKLYKTFKKFKEQMILEYFTEEKPKLTHREIEIARLAAEGITNSNIGKQLYISPNTVKMALKSIYAKLSINNRALLQQHLDDLEQ